jgi:hypothetical protein
MRVFRGGGEGRESSGVCFSLLRKELSALVLMGRSLERNSMSEIE